MIKISCGRALGMSLLMVLIMLLCSIDSTAQCACARGAKQRMEGSDHVFVAEVLALEKSGLRLNRRSYNRFRVKVNEVWGKELPKIVTVLDLAGHVSPVTVSETWVLFASVDRRGRLILDRHCCAWIKRLKDSKLQGEYEAISEFAGMPKTVEQE